MKGEADQGGSGSRRDHVDTWKRWASWRRAGGQGHSDDT